MNSSTASSLFDELILEIFSNLDLRSRINAASVSRRWAKLSRKSWRSLRTLRFHDYYDPSYFPRGRGLNRALNYFLKRCGRNLVTLCIHDPEPEERFVRINENTCIVIGRYCKNLQIIDFAGLLIINNLLHDLVRYVPCTNVRIIDFNRSFAHQCPIHDGLTAIYNACPALVELNLYSALNARVRDCQEQWPRTLTKVYLDHCMSFTGYSLLMLSQCSPMLKTFSMSGNMRGMNFGINAIIKGCPDIEELILRDFPGEESVGMEICHLPKLKKLQLGNSNMVTDSIICAIAYSCRELESLECNLEHYEKDKPLTITDRCLTELAEYCKGLKHLQLDGRQMITDHGLISVILQGNLEFLSLERCSNITNLSLEILGVNCPKLRNLDISDAVQLTPEVIMQICHTWMTNECDKRAYQLDLVAENLGLTSEMFTSQFESENSSSSDNFTLGWLKPRRKLKVLNVF